MQIIGWQTLGFSLQHAAQYFTQLRISRLIPGHHTMSLALSLHLLTL